jgi:tetratricopeptide (TPR) repeat protein
MNSHDPKFAKAVQLHQAGEIAVAIKLYEKVVRGSPKNAVALNLLGLACFQAGNLERAADAIGKALAIKPDLPDAHYNLATILQALGRYEQAVTHYRLALATRGADPDAQNNMGTALKALGRVEEAIVHFRQAVALRRGWGVAHFNLANALHENNQDEEAIGHYEQAIGLMPNPADAHVNFGIALQSLGGHADAVDQFKLALARKPGDAVTHYNLGNALRELQELDGAAEQYRRALQAKPDYAEALVNLGTTLFLLGQTDEAKHCFERALAIKPGESEAHFGLARVFNMLDRHEDAAEQFRMAAAIEPNSANAVANMGSALRMLGRNEEAMRAFERALEIDPRSETALFGMVALPMSLGDFSTGWAHMERFRDAGLIKGGPKNLPQPRWDGLPVRGTLLLWGDQGLGDQILYAGMVEEIGDRASRVVLYVEPKLVSLFARSFPQFEVIGPSGLAGIGTIDVQEPLPGLGRFLRPDWASFPKRERGYLVPDRERAARLRERLKRDGSSVVGISWRSTNPKIAREKSIKLRDFEPLLRMPGVRFVDLQYGDTQTERESVARELGIEVLHIDEIDNTNDIDGLASLIDACDAIVSVSNTNAHIAGALGKPTIVLVREMMGRIWYWFGGRDDSPWYPHVRVLSQARGQAWADLVRAVPPELDKFRTT